MKKMDAILCTSLTPNNLSLQQKAIHSWRDAGFDAISVNCKEEISQLSSNFTDIKFVKIDRDAREKHGKPLVYLDDVLTALNTTNASISGIINSDIILRAPGLSSKLNDKIKGHCFLGNRINVPKITKTDGTRYVLGYDYFIFDPSLPPQIPKTNFCLGMPWWDYWLPMAANLFGFSTVYIDSNIAFHQSHSTNWENNTFYQYGFEMKEILQEHLGDACRQQLEKFISTYFDKDIKKCQIASRALESNQTDPAILPPFAEALCAFIKHSAKTTELRS